ncbi:hypothetical protein PGB28_09380 [Primorskyibacter aestuariivivens]|uniref:CBU_0592 family membrane protein n=1 Tax=Primorskyibacter aestuariivivens TaxID=1888912 RepID=UPI002301E175|nr:hypothetical protein [Primorskyibacter aestuariivivens]MDA7428670.1 hypothetical protein [Primorskyibacter aestuariivivens]
MFEFISQIGITDDALRMIGVLGFFFYIGGFAALQLEVLDGSGITYSVVNILAASLVLISLAGDFNLASAMIQASWIVIGFSGLSLRLWQRRRAMRMWDEANSRGHARGLQ